MSAPEAANNDKGTPVVTKDNYKEISRGGRLSMKPQIQEKLRNELKEIAFDNCKDAIKALGECSKREGMLVAFNCRDMNKAMNRCLDNYFTDELFDEYVRSKGYEPLPRYTSLPTRLVDGVAGLFK